MEYKEQICYPKVCLRIKIIKGGGGGFNLKLNAILRGLKKGQKRRLFLKHHQTVETHARAPWVRLGGNCFGVHLIIFYYKFYF